MIIIVSIHLEEEKKEKKYKKEGNKTILVLVFATILFFNVFLIVYFWDPGFSLVYYILSAASVWCIVLILSNGKSEKKKLKR